jgi:hypothetical protein
VRLPVEALRRSATKEATGETTDMRERAQHGGLPGGVCSVEADDGQHAFPARGLDLDLASCALVQLGGDKGDLLFVAD